MAVVGGAGTGKTSLMLEAVEAIKLAREEGKSIQDPGVRRWAYHAGKVSACIQHCHHGCAETFLKGTPCFSISKFVCVYKKSHEVKLL